MHVEMSFEYLYSFFLISVQFIDSPQKNCSSVVFGFTFVA